MKAEQTEFDMAVELGRKAVSLSPKHVPNIAFFAVVLARAGNNLEALQQIKRAIRLSPIYPAWYLHIFASSSFALGEEEDAARAYRACLDRTDPDSAFMPIARVWLAVCLASAGRNAEARAVRADVLKQDPDFSIENWWQLPRKDWSVRERAIEIWDKIGN